MLLQFYLDIIHKGYQIESIQMGVDLSFRHILQVLDQGL